MYIYVCIYTHKNNIYIYTYVYDHAAIQQFTSTTQTRLVDSIHCDDSIQFVGSRRAAIRAVLRGKK